MNLKKEKRDETTASRHMSYLTILGTYMTIFGTVLGLVLSWGQLRLAHIESERARRAEPLSYSLEAVDTHYQYEIQKMGRPCPSQPPPPAYRSAMAASTPSLPSVLMGRPCMSWRSFPSRTVGMGVLWMSLCLQRP